MFSKFKIIIVIFLGLLTFSNVASAKETDCALLPAQRSEADVPVEAGLTSIPGSDSLIAHAVNYGTLFTRLIPRDIKDPRFHTHIWIVDKVNCKKILALPLPIDASINVEGITVDTHALPITRLPDGNLEIKYSFAVPQKLDTITIRKLIIDKNWKIIDTQDILLKIKTDARKAVYLGDWKGSGQIFHITEPLPETQNTDLKSYFHSIIYFADKQIRLYQFANTFPEFTFLRDGIFLDDTRPYIRDRYYPRYFLVTAFDPQLKYFRQFTAPQPSPRSGIINYLYYYETPEQSLIQVGTRLITINGKIVKPKHAKGTVLPDYGGKDRLLGSHIETYLWQNDKWVVAPELEPVNVNSSELNKLTTNWPTQ